jgi:hypothetical protein
MQESTNKYRDRINGTLSGFHRLVFRGPPRRLNCGYWDREWQSLVAQGMEQYLWQNHILFKDYLDHVKRVSQKVKQASVKPFESQGLPVEFLRNPSADKDEIARAIAAERKVESGLVCALSSVELSPSFEHRGTHLVLRVKPCQVLYQYQIHPQVGWMYARIQTWFPFNIQVGLNGREWLARQRDQQGLKYRQQGNCFVRIEDCGQAQKPMEIAAYDASGTYRANYTVSIGESIYAIHAFRKKSKAGIATPKPEMEPIRQRLKELRSEVKNAEKRGP